MHSRRPNGSRLDFTRFEAFRDGEVRLREVLPKAHALARESGYKAETPNPAAAALLPHITDDNLRSLMVYPVEKGWVADLVLVDLPGGIPSRIGIPEREALPTREEAVAEGFHMLVGLLAVSEFPIFELHGVGIPLSRVVLDNIRKTREGSVKGYSGQVEAHERIETILAAVMPNGFNLEAFKGLSAKERAYINVILHFSALSGVVVHP